jgi:hypothetical protein
VDPMSVDFMCPMLTSTCCNSDQWIWWCGDASSEVSCDRARDININITSLVLGQLKG